MKSILPASIIALALLSCGNNNKSSAQKSTDEVSGTKKLPPVETENANTDFQPAFEGQTRVLVSEPQQLMKPI